MPDPHPMSTSSRCWPQLGHCLLGKNSLPHSGHFLLWVSPRYSRHAPQITLCHNFLFQGPSPLPSVGNTRQGLKFVCEWPTQALVGMLAQMNSLYQSLLISAPAAPGHMRQEGLVHREKATGEVVKQHLFLSS